MSEPRPRLKRDWIGRQVRTRVELRNGLVIIPVGTVCTVSDNHSGLRLRSEPCGSCGVRVVISKVPERDVVLLPVQPVPGPVYLDGTS